MKAVKICVIAVLAVTVMCGSVWALPVIDSPEIDPSSISSAVALLAGSVMLLTSKRRTK